MINRALPPPPEGKTRIVCMGCGWHDEVPTTLATDPDRLTALICTACKTNSFSLEGSADLTNFGIVPCRDDGKDVVQPDGRAYVYDERSNVA